MSDLFRIFTVTNHYLYRSFNNTTQVANSNGADQIVRPHRLISVFVVCIWHKLLLTSSVTPAAIVCPPDRNINRPSSLLSLYSSRHTGRSNSISTTALEFFVKHLEYMKTFSDKFLSKLMSGPVVQSGASVWYSSGCGFDPRVRQNILLWRLVMKSFLQPVSPCS